MNVPADTMAAPAPRPVNDPRLARSFVTPEGVDLGLRLASAAERAGAFLIDALIITACLVVLTLLAAFGSFAGVGDNAEIAVVIWTLVAFLLRNFYFVFFELGPRAATPGKRLLGLRVASRGGGALRGDAIFARNAMREIEVFLPLSFLAAATGSVDGWIAAVGLLWCLVFVFMPAFNRDRLRAGDLVAGTWVVRAPRRALLTDLSRAAAAAAAEFAFTPEQLDAYGVKELHVLEDVLRTADPETLAAVAKRIRGRIGWTRRDAENDVAFLRAYYAGLRARLEAGLLMGVRRRDKLDRPARRD
jgi:uncharacterized RDD family membrane protein YckC